MDIFVEEISQKQFNRFDLCFKQCKVTYSNLCIVLFPTKSVQAVFEKIEFEFITDCNNCVVASVWFYWFDRAKMVEPFWFLFSKKLTRFFELLYRLIFSKSMKQWALRKQSLTLSLISIGVWLRCLNVT